MNEIKEAVREKYSNAARSVLTGKPSCCSTAASSCDDTMTRDLYELAETENLPAEAVLASLGCGNPTAVAQLAPGEVVLDLGSGGGIDVLLSAKRVGPQGRAIGLDMTDEMLELARANAARAGATNVEFLKGDIEEIPLPDGSVDVIISNCVINLSADKPRVIREMFRVLRSGGRIAISDVVRRGEMPEEIRKNLELWAGCISGALEESEYRTYLNDAGFSAIELEDTRTHHEGLYSAIVRAVKE